MKFGDFIKCPKCGKVVDPTNVIINRANIKNDSQEDYFKEESKLCRDYDNIFINGVCNNCYNKFESMIILDIKPIESYSAKDRSSLVMLDDNAHEDKNN